MLILDKPNATQSPTVSVTAPSAQPPKLLDRMRAAIRVRHYKGGRGVVSPLDRVTA